MIMAWLRGIIQPADDPRIAGLMNLMRRFEIEKDATMSRLDELTAIVVEVGAVVDSVISHVHALTARADAAGVEDPAVGAAVDTLRATRDRLNAVLPAPEPVAVEG